MKKDSYSPPTWITKLLSRVCKAHLLEEIEGDLLEFYELWVAEDGPAKANRKYLWHAFKFLRFYSLKSLIPSRAKSNLMIDHYFKLAWRNLLKRRANALINVVGLSLGFASSLLIFLWVEKETNIDRFHTDSHRIFNVYSRFSFPGGLQTLRNTPAKLPAELQAIIPEVEYSTGFAKSFRLSLQGVTAETFQKGDVILKMKGSRGSPQFFSIFSFKILEGLPNDALLDRSSIAISRKMANIFFGSPEAAINQSIRYQNEKNLIVSLVFEDIGEESSLQFDYLTNWDAWVDGDEFKPGWDHFGTHTYIKLKEGTNVAAVEEKLRDVLPQYIEFGEGETAELGLQPFEEQYLYGNFENGRPAGGRIRSVRVFQGIAVFILLIAIINFINLSTANATQRAKEVGVRKVVGALRRNLIHQFLAESLLITFVSTAIGLLLTLALLPVLEVLTESQLSLPITDPYFLPGLLLIASAIGLLAGGYPSLVLSKIGLLPALSKRSDNGANTGKLRKALVVFQFGISIVLTVATIVLSSQMQFLVNKTLGFDRDNLIYVPIEGSLVSDYRTFKDEAVKIPGVLTVDRSSQTPHKMGFSGPFFNWDGQEEGNNTSFTPSSVGFDFVETMGIEVVRGRGFDRSRPADSTNFLVNETAERAMGGDVLNKTASIFGKQGKIIGVIKDFHFNSLHTPITPMVLDVKEGLNFGTITIRLESQTLRNTLAQLETLHAQINPGYAFDYTFVNRMYEDEYRAEQLVSSLVPNFAGLAIFISCLGLFGLVTFATQRRVKEIGIRKVLGASVTQILQLLSKDFALLVVIAIFVATPISYMIMRDWLAGFAYSIDLSWWIFALAILVAIGISYLIILGRVWQSATSNPVGSLRSE